MTFFTQYKQNKFKNKRTEFGGRIYASKLESSVAADLELARHATNKKDKVVEIWPQHNIDIYLDGTTLTRKPTSNKLFRYIIDFKVQYADGRIEYVEAKGLAMALWRFKWKVTEAVLNAEEPEAVLRVIK